MCAVDVHFPQVIKAVTVLRRGDVAHRQRGLRAGFRGQAAVHSGAVLSPDIGGAPSLALAINDAVVLSKVEFN